MDRYKLWENDIVLSPDEPSIGSVSCDECGREFEYKAKDLHVGEYGCFFVKCPYCDGETPTGDCEDVTYLSFRYPTHFRKTIRGEGPFKISDSEVVDRIKKGIHYLRQHRGERVYSIESGDTFTLVVRYEGDEEYFVLNTHNYESTFIYFDETDQKLYGDKYGMISAAIDNIRDEVDYLFDDKKNI